MRFSKLAVWVLSALLAPLVGFSFISSAMSHSSAPPPPVLERSQAVADYDDDDDEPIYWEHDDEHGGPWEEVLISPRERKIIWDFYHSGHPVLAERRNPPPWIKTEAFTDGQLPADWASRVDIHRMVPTDIYGGSYSIPAELLRQLPPQPAGTYLIQTGNRIIRIYNETRRIADMMAI